MSTQDQEPQQRTRSLSRTFLVGLLAGGMVAAAGGTAVWALSSSEESVATEDVANHTHADGEESHDHGSTDEQGTTDEGPDHSNHEDGLVIHDSTGGREATDEDRANAEAFYDEVAAALAQYEDIDVAIAAGYMESENDAAQSISHYMKRGVNGAALDPGQPSGLVYYEDDNQATLIGAVWTTQADDPLQPGGPLTLWHDHSSMGCPPAHPDCPAATGGEGAGNPPKMFHVWLFEAAEDPFGHSFVDALGREKPEGQSPSERPGLPFDV